MQSIHNDEDWSIISSSSDMDDDQSTSSSILESSRNLSPEQDKSVSSVGTLKLPIISPDNDVSGRPELAAGPRKPIVRPIVEKITQAEDRHIDNVIRFYESLSNTTGKWNDSIKKKSSEFYQNIAKLKLEQIGKFISSRDSVDAANTDERKENTPADVVVASDEDRATVSLHNPGKSSTTCFGHTFDCIQNSLDNNSEYVLYYLVSGILGISSLIVLYYNINWSGISYHEKQPPYPSIFSVSQDYVAKVALDCKTYLEDIFYEDSYPASNFFGLYPVTPSKTIRLSRKLNFWKESNIFSLKECIWSLKQRGSRNFHTWWTYFKRSRTSNISIWLAKLRRSRTSLCIWWAHFKRNEFVEVGNLWHHLKQHWVFRFHYLSYKLHHAAVYTRHGSESITGSFNRYCNTHFIRHIFHRAKFNFDNGAKFIYKSSYPLRKFVADSMNV